jgi:hypothetical protein
MDKETNDAKVQEARSSSGACRHQQWDEKERGGP